MSEESYLDNIVAFTQVEGVQDYLLATLVDLVENDAISSVSVTLNVAGQVITGDLCKRGMWFDAIMSKADGNAALIIGQLQEALSSPAPEPQENEATGRTFLHLRDAKLVAGDSLGTAAGHWRCRIGDVGAWCFGSIS